jgi:hypothetical protein
VAGELDARTQAEPRGHPPRLALGSLVGTDQHQPQIVAYERDCFERRNWILPGLKCPDEERVRRFTARRTVRREERVDAVRRHHDLLRRNPVMLDEVPLRPLRDGEHAGRAPDRARHHRPEDEPVAAAHQLRVALEREVVNGHDRGTAAPPRDHMLEVDERRIEATQQPRHSDAHPDDLAVGVEPDRFDTVWHELRPARHGPKPQSMVELCQLREQGRDVALVPGAPASEDVGVEDDERLAHAATSR